MPPPLMQKDEVITKLIATFRRWGYDGATLSRLSEATGLVKASLYHYFPKGKQDMARAVLDTVHLQFQEQVIQPMQQAEASRESLEAFAQNLIDFYMEGNASCLLEVFTLGSAREIFAESVKGSLEKLKDCLADFLEKSGYDPETAAVKARRGVIAVQGALVTHRGLGEDAFFGEAMKDLPDLLMPRDP
ncbi:MAG: TetR/AcrR family transcriptional regulator [Acidobacteriota bacterium]|nr:TetR/AcrR family transcriptional regulator [Acidobacteriota bacterium]